MTKELEIEKVLQKYLHHDNGCVFLSMGVPHKECSCGLQQAWYNIKEARTALQGRDEVDDGKLWSAIRTLLTQGEAIYQDYKDKPYEEYSARLDAAARERIDWLKRQLKSEQSKETHP